MSSIAIITDSDASLPPELAAQHSIRVVPIAVHFGDETFRTGIDINEAEVFARIDREGKLPTTSAPSPGQFAETFEAALAAGATQIVCLCVSGEVSATYNAAVTAAEMFGDRDITVIDTQRLSMGQGFMVLAAAQAAAGGASKEQIVARARDVGERSHLFAALSTLKYLAMSGRVGHLAAGMAGLLNIKPILTVRNGKLDMLEKVRTRHKAWNRVIELTAGVAGDQPVEQMAIVHVNVPDQAEQFKQQLIDAIRCDGEILIADLTAGLSVHSGSGMVGVAVITRQ